MSRPRTSLTTATSPISRAIQEYKLHEKLTMVQLGKVIGLNKETLVQLASDTRFPSTRALKKLARFFQWSPEEVGVAAMFKPKKKGRKK